MKRKEWSTGIKLCRHATKEDKRDGSLMGITCLLCRHTSIRREDELVETLSHEYLHVLFYEWVRSGQMGGLEYYWTLWLLDHRKGSEGIGSGAVQRADWVVQ